MDRDRGPQPPRAWPPEARYRPGSAGHPGVCGGNTRCRGTPRQIFPGIPAASAPVVPPVVPASKADLVITTNPVLFTAGPKIGEVETNCINFIVKGLDVNGDVISRSVYNVKMISDKQPNSIWYFRDWGSGGSEGEIYCAQAEQGGTTNFTFTWPENNIRKVITLDMVAPTN